MNDQDNNTSNWGNKDQDLTSRITQLTSLIQERYPELLPYLNEIPVTMPNDPHPEVNHKILQDYYDSLNQIVRNHEKNKPSGDTDY
jgi:hypothetical protein